MNAADHAAGRSLVIDISEIASILGSSLYKVSNIQNDVTKDDSSEESKKVSSVANSACTDSYESTILKSMEAISSGTYNNMSQEVNEYGSQAVPITLSADEVAEAGATDAASGTGDSGNGSDSSKNKITSEVITGVDGSVYLKITTTTPDGESTVELKKMSGPVKKSQNDGTDLNSDSGIKAGYKPEHMRDSKPNGKSDQDAADKIMA